MILYSFFFFWKKMALIDLEFFRSFSPEKLLVKIWDYSYHVHHKSPANKENCNCEHYLNLCIEAAREQWHDDFLFFDTALYRFQFHRKLLIEIMSTKNERILENFIGCYLREK